MPEGDTIRKVADALRPQLLGQTVLRLWLYDRDEVSWLTGALITAINPRGKHMMITFSGHEDGDWALRVHLGLNGTWRWFRELRSGRFGSRIELSIKEISFVCIKPAQVELLRASKLRSHPKLRRLGPDLLDDEVNYEEIVRRALSPGQHGRAIGEVLLDQNVAAGIGNVYRSEILFIEKLWPHTPVNELSEARIRQVYERASDLLKRNITYGARVTTPRTRLARGPNLFAYGRSSEPCLVCGSTIAFERSGDLARPLYSCVRCQKKDR